jgi:hypothetical protein
MGVDGPSSLVASLSVEEKLLKGRVDVAFTNGVRWGIQPALATALLHFPEMEKELKLLGFGRNMDVMEDQVDALWIWARPALDSLASHVLPSVARIPPDGAGE